MSLYRSPNIVKLIKSTRLRWAGYIAKMKVRGKPVRKKPLGKPRRRWEDSIRRDLTEISVNARNRVDSAQDRDNRKIPCDPLTLQVLKNRLAFDHSYLM